MALQSMTGFARSQGHAAGGAASGKWTWELRSVNSKGLEVRFRLPPGFDSCESEFRRLVSSRIARGNIQASLQFERDHGVSVPIVNEAALEAVIAAVKRISERLGSPPPAAELMLQIRGVLESGEEQASVAETDVRNAEIGAGLAKAVEQLCLSRAAEGKAVANVLIGQVDTIEGLVSRIEADPSRTAAALRERLQAQLALLLDDTSRLDPQRLHQEAALLATKADLREEIDRLHAHVDAARVLLTGNGPAGRKLDFLAQEFNRECNTICSKSNASTVTTLGLDLKVVIDQFREQVQNIE